MSATPKIFTDSSKGKAEKDETLLYSMDDENIFGRVAYELDFGKAQAQGLLTEYKVLISIIDEGSVASITNQLSKGKKDGEVILNVDGKDVAVDVELVAKIIATYKSLLKQDVYIINGNDKEILGDDDKKNIMRRAIAFNSSIKSSKIRQAVFNPTIDIYNDIEKKQEKDLYIDHIDGTMNQSIKSTKLSWLKSKDDDIRILSDAKCLTEGVDVPALDAVIFFDARDSIVDIVQAVGRVMRKAEGKEVGYIILPIMLPKDQETNYDNILTNDKFKVVWKILKAIRSHDASLVSEVEYLKKIAVARISDKIEDPNPTSNNDDTSGIETSELENKGYDENFLFGFDELARSIYAVIPNKLGDREYWSSFAKNVAKIVPILEERIKEIIKSDSSVQKEFEKFLKALRENINSSVSEQDAIVMLVQHIITRPIFEAIFTNGEFKLKNAVSKSMEKVHSKLQAYGLDDETTSLSALYRSIGENASYAKSDKEKQEIIKNLYDNFFNSAFKKESEKLGIVYTPIEVVDFIIHSVEYVLNKHFGKKLKDKNVNILDPFTETGTFIVRLIQSGLLNGNLEHKFKHELHANEITLLAYYIANLNISAAYHTAMNDENAENYEMLSNLLLTDTFEMTERADWLEALEDEMLGENKNAIKKQRNTPIDVIIGNPPYSNGQGSANDNNKRCLTSIS